MTTLNAVLSMKAMLEARTELTKTQRALARGSAPG
jgi:hypothetical protein